MRQHTSLFRHAATTSLAVLLSTTGAVTAETFRVDRDRSEAFDMKVVELAPPILMSTSAAGGGVATIRHPETVSAVRIRARVTPAAGAWTLRFRTLSGELAEEITSSAPQVLAGEVWSDLVRGRGSDVEVTGPSGVTVTIDAYAHTEAQAAPMSIHGKNQLVAITKAPAVAARFAAPVGRLRFMTRKGQAFCSGFMVAPELFMTNNHCIATAGDAASAVVELGYDGYSAPISSHRVRKLEATHASLDMSILRIVPRPASSWGQLTLGRRPSSGALPVLIVQHPGGAPKHASVDDCVVSGLQKTGLGATGTDFGHKCDTEGGSSGSPVVDPVTGSVVGLHHLGFYDDDPNPVNQAVQMDGILSFLESAHPALRAELTVLP